MPRFGRHNKDTCSWELKNSRINTKLDTKWRKRVNWTDYISERVISTSITVNKQHVLLMNVYFHHSGGDHHVEKVHRWKGKLTKSKKKSIQTVGGYFNAEMGPGLGVERVSVGPHTLKEGNKSGGQMKRWLMIQHFTKLNTMYRKTLEKQATYRTPKGAENTVGLFIGGQGTHVLQQRRRSKRHDPHGKRPEKCYGTICDYSTKEGSLTKKTHIAKKKIQTAESTKSHYDAKTRSDEANKF